MTMTTTLHEDPRSPIRMSHPSQNPNAEPTPTEEDRFYSTDYVAQMFHVTAETVRNWITKGELKSKVISGRHRISHRELQRFANHRFGPES